MTYMDSVSWQSLYWLNVVLADHPHSGTTWHNQTIYSDRWWEGSVHDLCSLALTQWQSVGGFLWVFFKFKLDRVVAGLPCCLCALVATKRAVLASSKIVGYYDVTLLVPHAVSMISLKQKPLIFPQLSGWVTILCCLTCLIHVKH